jgi:hypothetical protein
MERTAGSRPSRAAVATVSTLHFPKLATAVQFGVCGIVGGVCEKRGMIQEVCRGWPIFTRTALAEGERAGGTDDIRFRISG